MTILALGRLLVTVALAPRLQLHLLAVLLTIVRTRVLVMVALMIQLLPMVVHIDLLMEEKHNRFLRILRLASGVARRIKDLENMD